MKKIDGAYDDTQNASFVFRDAQSGLGSLRLLMPLAGTLLLLSGCSERKQPAFAECHRIFNADITAPEELIMRSIDLCMESGGYKRNKSACTSVAALTPDCYAPNWPWYLLDLLG